MERDMHFAVYREFGVFTISMTWPGMVFEETYLFILVMEYIQPSGILRFHLCRFNQPWINTK